MMINKKIKKIIKTKSKHK